MGDLHADVLRGQCETVQVVVSRCIGISVQTGGEVTAGHGHTHHSISDTCQRDSCIAKFEYQHEDIWFVYIFTPSEGKWYCFQLVCVLVCLLLS